MRRLARSPAGSTRALLVAMLLMTVVGTVAAGCSAGDDGAASSAATTTTSAGSTSSAAAAAPARTALAPPPAPASPACYQLSFSQAVSPTSAQAAVACTTAHTSQTFLVRRAQPVVDGHLVAIDSDRVQREVADTCPKRLATYLGGTVEQQRLSLLRAVWFTPTVAESDAGADWYRCDVVAAVGDQDLAELGDDLKGALGDPRTRSAYAMCATDRPGTTDFRRVLCSDSHTWKAIRTVDLSGLAGPGGRFPGLTAVEQGDEQGGQQVCADAARAVAPDALDYQWGYEWPTRDQWRTGQEFGRCWAPDAASS